MIFINDRGKDMNNLNDIVVVDYEDNQIGKTSKELAHSKGILHRAFSVYIINEKKEVLLQKRNINKYHSGGLWSNTCCSHPTSNCDLLEFASERLYQELGIEAQLEEIGQFVYRNEFDNKLIEYEYDHVLFGVVTGEKVVPNVQEIDSFAWYKINEIEEMLIENPKLFTAWFFQSFHIFKNFIKRI